VLYGDIHHGDVLVQDIIHLVEPAEISTNLLNYLLRAAFPAGHPTVTLAGHELTNAIINIDWNRMYYDEAEIGHVLLHSFLEQVWHKEWIVFLLHKDGWHFTTLVVHYHLAIDASSNLVRGQLRYLDSFHDGHPRLLARVESFLNWSFQHSTMPHLTGHLEHFQGNPNPAIRQPKYLGRGQHIDEARHIDCGLYAYFNTLQTVSNGSSYGLTPEGIHYSR